MCHLSTVKKKIGSNHPNVLCKKKLSEKIFCKTHKKTLVMKFSFRKAAWLILPLHRCCEVKDQVAS